MFYLDPLGLSLVLEKTLKSSSIQFRYLGVLLGFLRIKLRSGDGPQKLINWSPKNQFWNQSHFLICASYFLIFFELNVLLAHSFKEGQNVIPQNWLIAMIPILVYLDQC